MRLLVLTPKFKRAFRRFVKRNTELQQRIEDTLQQMEADVFAPALSEWNETVGQFTVGLTPSPLKHWFGVAFPP
ncbi:MAG: hypothetical protein V7K70_15730 [Nostoc sp.]